MNGLIAGRLRLSVAGYWIYLDEERVLGPCIFLKHRGQVTVQPLYGEPLVFSAMYCFVEGVNGVGSFSTLADGPYNNELESTEE